jgi:lysophospholipase L1-like esterase
MAARLVTIGDSLTQGFQHGAIRRTAWAYPAMLARALGAEPFRSPDFTADGHGGPLLDLELLLRRLAQHTGAELDWWDIPRTLLTLQTSLGAIEQYWERGAGARPSATGPCHHNLAVWGFQVLDALTLSDASCAQAMPQPRDNLIDQLPEFAMYRTARRVLNPGQQRELLELTQLGVAALVAEREGGIENLIVGLGANNALGTCVELKVRRSRSTDLALLSHERDCNLWEPEHFALSFRDLARQVDSIPAERVFLMTVPHVTIAPVTRGVSPVAHARGEREVAGGYYEYYTHFWIWDDDFSTARNAYLTRDQARQIDFTIDAYNESVREEARLRGWYVIDLCQVLDDLAFRRHEGRPPYRLPQGLVSALLENPRTRFRVRPEGEVLLDTRFSRLPSKAPEANAPSDVWREAYKGGLFGLDGVHPSTVGYGIIAHEVLRALRNAGVPGADPARLDWHAIVAADSLLVDPPRLLQSLEATLNALFAKLPLDALIEKLGGLGAEEF